jgi:hypothetical protein
MPGGPQGGNATDIILFLHGGDMQENQPVEDTNTNNSYGASRNSLHQKLVIALKLD